MTDREWSAIVAVFTANWPHQLPPNASLAKWRRDLDHLPAEQVLVGVEALYRDGREFPPNGAQILAKVSELDRDPIGYGEAWRLAKKASLKADPHEGFNWLHERSPEAAEAVGQMCGLQLTYMLDDEATTRAQFRDVYRSVVATRKRDDAYAGLPNAGLRGLERGPRKLGDALKRALPERTV
jgi:hypothetical protein